MTRPRLQGGSAPLRVLPAGLRAQIARWAGRHQSSSVIVTVLILGVLLPLASQLPIISHFGNLNDFIDGYSNAGVFILLALGLNVVVGLAGLLDLGYAAFFAIGSYAYAFSASPFTGLHVPFWPMLIVGALVAALFGILLGAPTLRLRGDYLAIVTLGFGEIVPVVFLNSDKYTKGTNGISGIYQPSLPIIGNFGFGNPWPYYITVFTIIAVAVVLLYRLQDSRLGRAWMAIREDELAAASMGINTVTTKLLAFAIGASTSGLAGVFNASKLSLVSPDQFGFTVSFTVLAMVVLGGMGNIWGVAVGAFVLYEIQSVFLKQMTTFVQGLPFALTIPMISIALGLVVLVILGMRAARRGGSMQSTASGPWYRAWAGWLGPGWTGGVQVLAGVGALLALISAFGSSPGAAAEGAALVLLVAYGYLAWAISHRRPDAWVVGVVVAAVAIVVNGAMVALGFGLSINGVDFVQYQFLLYGIALVSMMLLRPEGLFPSRQRKRELRADLEELDVTDVEFSPEGEA